MNVFGNLGGRTLVFAHGFGCSSKVWRDVAPEFLHDYRVVLFDHIGAGHSDLTAYDRGKYDSLHGYADDLREIRDTFDFRDVVFVGHSVSAMIGVLAAIRDPSRFGKLVLVGLSPRDVKDRDYFGGFEQQDIDSLLEALDANYLGWSSAMAPVIMGNPDRPELGAALTESFCCTDPAIARHFAHVTFLSDNRADLPRVSTPTLVLQSSDDVIAPLTVGQFVHNEIAGSELVVLESTGHLPGLSGPQELVRAIKAYLP